MDGMTEPEKPDTEEMDKSVGEVLEKIDTDIAERKEKRRARWIHRHPHHTLDEPARHLRREENKAKAARRKMRSRRRHGRPVGR